MYGHDLTSCCGPLRFCIAAHKKCTRLNQGSKLETWTFDQMTPVVRANNLFFFFLGKLLQSCQSHFFKRNYQNQSFLEGGRGGVPPDPCRLWHVSNAIPSEHDHTFFFFGGGGGLNGPVFRCALPH